jgi:hypothetical protein
MTDGRTGFESNGHRVDDGAHGRPDLSGQFDLARVGIAGDRRLEDEIAAGAVWNEVLQGPQAALCDSNDTLLPGQRLKSQNSEDGDGKGDCWGGGERLTS